MAKTGKSKRWRWLLATVLILAAAGTGFLLLKAQSRLFSSPTQPRAKENFDDQTLISFESRKLEPVLTRGLDPSVPFTDFELVPMKSDSNIRDLIEFRIEKPTTRHPASLPNRFSNSGPVGDDEIELVAFSMLFPSRRGEIDSSKFGPTRHADSLEIITEKEREELGLPYGSIAEIPHRPTVQLWFRFRNFDHVRIRNCEVGDARTGVLLGESDAVFANSNQEWIPVLVPLDCWHDTPVRVRLEFLTGEPLYEDLRRESGAEVEFEDRLRVQFVGEFRDPNFETPVRIGGGFSGAGALSSNQNLFHIEPLKGRNARRFAILRVSNPRLAGSHSAFVGENGEDVWWGLMGRGHVGRDYIIYRVPIPDSAQHNSASLKIALLPKIAELEFEISGLPDMPNSRETENLFEVRISSLPLWASESERPLIEAAAAAAQVKLDLKNEIWISTRLGSGRPDYDMSDFTPQQLLDSYVAGTPGANYRFDAERNVLIVNEEREKSKLKRAREWWNGWAPDWLKL